MAKYWHHLPTVHCIRDSICGLTLRIAPFFRASSEHLCGTSGGMPSFFFSVSSASCMACCEGCQCSFDPLRWVFESRICRSLFKTWVLSSAPRWCRYYLRWHVYAGIRALPVEGQLSSRTSRIDILYVLASNMDIGILQIYVQSAFGQLLCGFQTHNTASWRRSC